MAGQRPRIAKLHRAFGNSLQGSSAPWFAVGSQRAKGSAPVTLEDAERSHILQTLRQTEGVVGGPKGAAALLGLCRSTLISKMRRLGIHRWKRSEGATKSSTLRVSPSSRMKLRRTRLIDHVTTSPVSHCPDGSTTKQRRFAGMDHRFCIIGLPFVSAHSSERHQTTAESSPYPACANALR
jgi:hypothetical protein